MIAWLMEIERRLSSLEDAAVAADMFVLGTSEFVDDE